MYAPVVVFVYKRIDHVKEVLAALGRNYDIEFTDLYIFSDGPKNESEVSDVKSVRNYVKNYIADNRFKKSVLLEQEENKGLAGSIIEGVTKIINEYGRVIVLEDDHVTSPDFLQYMNGALDFYEKNDRIWSISGYTWKMKSFKNYHHDIFMGCRASCWGWASWKNRWNKIDWNVSGYDSFIRNRKQRKEFNRGGMDMSRLLQMQHDGEINSWAIRWCYQQYIEKMLCVFPVHSKVKNIGFDGSGTNSGKVTSFQTDLQKQEKFLYENLPLDAKITREFWWYYSKLYIRQVLGKYWYLLTEYEYCILYRETNRKKKEYGILKPSFRFWYADPMPVSIGNKDFVFVEMYDKLRKKGFIGISETDEQGSLRKPQRVIEEEFHLSFPYVFKHNNAYFMIPECSESGQIRIYKMGADPYHWNIYLKWNDYQGFVDTVVYSKEDGDLYLITSQENPENKYQTRLVLLLLTNLSDQTAADLKQIWRAADYSYYARNAGGIMKQQDTIYRAVQYSTAREYGKNIIIKQITEMNENGLIEKDCSKIKIGDLSYKLPAFIYRPWGTHTYGRSNKIEVLDLSVQRFSVGGLFYKVYRHIRRK